MAKIKIENLPVDETLDANAMTQVRGGWMDGLSTAIADIQYAYYQYSQGISYTGTTM